MRLKPSVMLDRMWAEQEAYIAELEAENAQLKLEVQKLNTEWRLSAQQMMGRTLELALSGQLGRMDDRRMEACGYDPPGQPTEEDA